MFRNVARHNSNSRANGAPQHQRFHEYKRRVAALPAAALDFVSGRFARDSAEVGCADERGRLAAGDVGGWLFSARHCTTDYNRRELAGVRVLDFFHPLSETKTITKL
jgi:hypothetical protein